ncbi:hypothetical protein EYF80_033478 [Liparis tanakae]|uniref:Uncharacterized protein n=1 Tax=Liparis tanakae TaxID=230148 RepID=A0A4Z2GU78_9TELE|nr:hypothetical protein EYF80_033478 [Liparis tanakae]
MPQRWRLWGEYMVIETSPSCAHSLPADPRVLKGLLLALSQASWLYSTGTGLSTWFSSSVSSGRVLLASRFFALQNLSRRFFHFSFTSSSDFPMPSAISLHERAALSQTSDKCHLSGGFDTWAGVSFSVVLRLCAPSSRLFRIEFEEFEFRQGVMLFVTSHSK